MPFKDFLSRLKSSVAAVHSALEEVNIAQLSDELLELNLVELDNEVNECKKKKSGNQNWKMYCFVCIDLKMHVVAVKLFSLRACCGNDAMDGEHQFCRWSVQKCMSDQTTKECNHVLILCRIRTCNNIRNISSNDLEHSSTCSNRR